MNFWQTYQSQIVAVVFLLGIGFFPLGTRLIALAALLLLTTSFDSLTKLGLLTVPHVTVAILAWKKYPSWGYAAFLLGFAGTVSEINKVDGRLRRNKIVSPDRRLLLEYLLEVSLKGLGVILLLGATAGFVYFLFVGITKTYAIIGGIVAVPLAGTILYLFRMNHRFWYGVSELCFAVMLAVFTIEQSFSSWRTNIAEFLTRPNLVARILALSASVYIVVRGLDNIGEHRVKRLQDIGKQQLGTVRAKLLARIRRRRVDGA